MSKHPVLTHVTKRKNPLIHNPHDPNKDTKGRKYLFDPFARVFNESTPQSTATGGSSSSRSHGIHVPANVKLQVPSHIVHHTADHPNSPMMAEQIVHHIANPVREQSVIDFRPMDIAENRISPVSRKTYQSNEVSHNLAGHVNSGEIGAVNVQPVTRWVGNYPDPNPFGSAVGAYISEDVEMTPKVADTVMESKLHDIQWPKGKKMNYKDPVPPPPVLGSRKRNDIFTPGGIRQKTKVEKKLIKRLMASTSQPTPEPLTQPSSNPKPTESKSKPVPPKKPEKPHPYQNVRQNARHKYKKAQKLYNLMKRPGTRGEAAQSKRRFDTYVKKHRVNKENLQL